MIHVYQTVLMKNAYDEIDTGKQVLCFQDKDSNGVSQVGVVVGVPPQTPPQWVEVEWPGGYSNTYRVGFGGKWDIRAA